MSTIEKQIEELEALKTVMQLDFDMGRVKAHGRSIKNRLKVIDNAIGTIKTQSEKIHAYAMERSSQYYHDGWIPCDERLPDSFGDYLVTMKHKKSQTNFVEIVLFDDNEEDFYIKGDRNQYKVIAWRPLPEAYREKER